METGFEQRHQNDLFGLQWIDRFGWLRSMELGRLLWPSDQYARTRADRVIRGWLARRLVIVRKLPDGAGRAVVLSEAGARLLRETGMAEARSGKDYGCVLAGGSWLPNREWKHDLKAAGILTLMYEEGFEIMTEHEIQRHHANLTKVPDGLFWPPETGQVCWLEVEQSEKRGQALNALANGLIIVSSGVAPAIGNRRATTAVVAYDPEAKDYRGDRLDHRRAISNAIRRNTKHDVAIHWCPCEMRGHGVVALKMENGSIKADLATRILSVLNAGGWHAQEGCQVANYGEHLASVWEDSDHHGWGYCIDDQMALIADNKTAAMYGCAQLLANQSKQ